MKKLIVLLLCSSFSLWGDGWIIDSKNSNNITYGYSNKDNISLDLAVSKMEGNFSIRILLDKKNKKLQDGLKSYYANEMPKELKKALFSSMNLHNPVFKPLKEKFPLAFQNTYFYKKMAKKLFEKGYIFQGDIWSEKFHTYKTSNGYAFNADIWLEATPFQVYWSNFLKNLSTIDCTKMTKMFASKIRCYICLENTSKERDELDTFRASKDWYSKLYNEKIYVNKEHFCKEDIPLIFTTNFMKKLRKNETIYHKIDENSSLDFEVVVTITQPNEIALGHEGTQHTFYFKNTLDGYKFSGIDTIP